MISKPEQVVDARYKKYILSHSCLVCPSREVDGDHLMARGRGSASQNDYSLIPLCRIHHSERHQIGNQKFEQRYTVNLWLEAWRLLAWWHKNQVWELLADAALEQLNGKENISF